MRTMRCRICRTARNLKFTPQQLRLQSKSKNNNNKLRLPLSAIPQTTGNICIDCDERLQNFHQLDDDSDVVDVDSDGFRENKKHQIEEPLIVDDPKRLYDLFYNNTALQCNEKSAMLCQTGSDGDPEVIEVLTSRETTPDTIANLNSNNVMKTIVVPANPTVIAVIDLEEEEDDDISRDKTKEFFQSDGSIKTLGRETRLLGCLNLVSSDSESEINFEPCTLDNNASSNKRSSHEKLSVCNLKESCINGAIECTNNNNINCKNTSVTIQHNLPVCIVCGINFMDKESLEIHMSNHADFKCPVCNVCFHMALDLVNHMRKKHRSYDGNDLCEGARCSQDSAMTIRLRYKQRLTFYECQLCGLIDSQFKSHKTHIIQKHADESKSLKDPMMKTQLKCPSCHQICGTHHLDVCRHLLAKHEDMESKIYLKEVTDLKILNINPKLLENLRHKARILTLGPKEQIFYECLLCKRTSGTYQTFSKHSNGHNIDEWKNYRSQSSKAVSNSPVKPKRTLKRKIETPNSSKSNTIMQSKVISKKNEQPPLKKPKLEYENKNKKSALHKDTKLRTYEIVTKKLPLPAQKTPNNMQTEFLTPPDMTNRQKKLKHKLGNKSQNKKGQLKAITKVKVKPPLRHFPTQKYYCKHCHLPFKGFRKLQLHLLSSHRAEEYFGCENCPKAFTSKASLEVHCSKNICRRKRKNTNEYIQNIDSDNLDENSNKEERKTCKYRRNSMDKELTNSKTYQKQQEKPLENFEPIWLKELLELSREKSLKINETAIDVSYDPTSRMISKGQHFNQTMQTLCRFCGCLKTCVEELVLHEKNHIALKDMPWIHYNHANQSSV